jgi:hypothetical protein
VVPLLGALLVWFTYRFARALGGEITGMVAAALLAAAPIFLFQVVQPVSDVPAAAWWLAALVVGGSRTGWRAVLAAGLLAAIAALTRPNLVPAAAAILLVTAFEAPESSDGARRLRIDTSRIIAFTAGLAPGIAFVAILNHRWYGSPLNSGYGSLSEIYGAASILPNLARYTRWALETQWAVLLLALPGVAIALRGAAARRPLIGGAVLLAVVVVACYLPYAVFEDWFYLRFLLPALPVVITFAAIALVTLARRLPAPARAPVLILSSTALLSLAIGQAYDRHAFGMWRFEGRYVNVGRDLAAIVPEDAVVLALQHSGSARFYSGRQTLRWDLLEPAWLDRAVTHLIERGRTPYLLLEAWEEPDFRRRFESSRLADRLNRPATREWTDVVRIRLFDLRP